jgi:transcriptional regulator with XRE-family HTH domain
VYTKSLLTTTMPKTVDPVDPKRFVQLLRVYLTKTGRKQAELARASSVTESMVSKVLKGKAQPNPENFCKFQAAFLVAHGGITQARQVTQMAALLGRDLDEADLLAIAKRVEHFKDPEQDTVYFRDRAEAFRVTIPAALSSTENNVTAELAAVDQLGAVAPPAVGDLQAEAIPEEGPEQSTVVSENVPADVRTVVAAWQAVLRDLISPEPVDTLQPDEVIAAVLDWESGPVNPEVAATVWDHLGTPAASEPFRQRARLEFVLQHVTADITWNHLEWQWLNHVLVETAQRQAGGAQLSPSQLAAFVMDLGRVAFAAVKADTAQRASVAVDLAELAQHLPMAQAISWRWLEHVAQTGLVQLSVSPDGRCMFASREEAEFLAAQYLIQTGADEVLLGIVQKGGRPFGVLTQAVRTLHFTGRDEAVEWLTGALLKVSEDLPLRYGDAAYLLAAAEAPASPLLQPTWLQLQADLYQSWPQSKAPAYREYVARAFRGQDCRIFARMLEEAVRAEMETGEHDPTTLHCFALMGGRSAVLHLADVGESQWVAAQGHHIQQGQTWHPLLAALEVVPELPPSEQVAVLERLALGHHTIGERWRTAKALAECGTIPAIRALERIVMAAADPEVARYAQKELQDLISPAQAVQVARDLDAAVADSNPTELLQRTHTASGLLVRSDSAMLAVLARALARVWANLDLSQEARTAAALGLTAARAAPAQDICLETLPLIGMAGNPDTSLLEHLLPALSTPAATARLWQLLERAASPAQRVLLLRCLGRAGGVSLDGRFEQLLAGPVEAVAAAAVAALVESQGQAVAERVAQIATTDGRSSVCTTASEALADIGSRLARPYLRQKVKEPLKHAEACQQLARQGSLEVEVLLVREVHTVTDQVARDQLYLPALAKSGGPAAILALRDLLGPEPDKMTLGLVRAELASDTVSRAPDEWRRLAADDSLTWCQTAVDVLVGDPSQTLIEDVIRMAVDGAHPGVREYAQTRLRTEVRQIASLAVMEYVLTRQEQQIDQTGQASDFLLDLLAKCLHGLATSRQRLPPETARRALELLWYILTRLRVSGEGMGPLLATMAFPEFAAAAEELERRLASSKGEPTRVQILDTLIAMKAPNLPDVTFRWAASDRWPVLQARATEWIVAHANLETLPQFPNALKPIAYQIAIQKGVRFLRSGLRHKVILANGAVYDTQSQ